MPSKIETLAGRLDFVLSQRRLSARQAAAKLGVSQAAVSRWLAGERQPDAAGLEALMVRLGVSANWLLTGEGSPEPDAADGAQYRAGRRDGLAEARLALIEMEAAHEAAGAPTPSGVPATLERAAKEMAEAKKRGPPTGRAVRQKDG